MPGRGRGTVNPVLSADCALAGLRGVGHGNRAQLSDQDLRQSTPQPNLSTPSSPPSRDGPFWWKHLDDSVVDPITLEPLNELSYPPFELDGNHLYDACELATWLLATHMFVNPMTRAPIDRATCIRLDAFLREFNLAPPGVCNAYDIAHSGAVRVAGSASVDGVVAGGGAARDASVAAASAASAAAAAAAASEDARHAALRREASLVISNLFDFHLGGGDASDGDRASAPAGQHNPGRRGSRVSRSHGRNQPTCPQQALEDRKAARILDLQNDVDPMSLSRAELKARNRAAIAAAKQALGSDGFKRFGKLAKTYSAPDLSATAAGKFFNAFGSLATTAGCAPARALAVLRQFAALHPSREVRIAGRKLRKIQTDSLGLRMQAPIRTCTSASAVAGAGAGTGARVPARSHSQSTLAFIESEAAAARATAVARYRSAVDSEPHYGDPSE